MFGLAGATTAAWVGVASAIAWPAAQLSVSVGVAMLAVALVLDRFGLPVPCVRRQVPPEWGRIFGAREAAVLYGCRMSVGPLTILTSWTWWVAFALGASAGPFAAALVGAMFHISRAATMELATSGVRSMAARMAVVRASERGVALTGAIVLVGLMLLLAACSSSPGNEAPAAVPTAVPTKPTTTIHPALPSPTPILSRPVEVPLQDLLITDPPSGFVHRNDAALDLAAAAAAEPDSIAERALLETRGFVAGHARTFTGDADAVIYVQVYEFADAVEAAAYLVDGADTLLGHGAEPYDVAMIENGFGFSQTDGGFEAHAVSWARGVHQFLVVAGGTGLSAADALAVAQHQYARSDVDAPHVGAARAT